MNRIKCLRSAFNMDTALFADNIGIPEKTLIEWEKPAIDRILGVEDCPDGHCGSIAEDIVNTVVSTQKKVTK